MDDDCSKKESKPAKQNNVDGLVVAAINLAAMSASVAAAISARKARKSTLESAVSELSVKVEKLSEQLRQMYGNAPAQATQPASTTTKGAAEQKEDNSQQQKPQDVIYVRKASEFWFYN